MRVRGEPHYLVSDSFHLIVNLVMTHPFLGTLLLVAVFAAVLGILRWNFGRLGYDVVVFALIVWAIVLLLGGGAYTYTHVQGFYFGG